MSRSLFAELKRRNVFRAVLLYVGAVWALTQGIAQLTPVVDAPEWAARWFLVAACIGFPFWIAFAWLYEWTPEGFRREREIEPEASITPLTGRKLDFAIIGVLAVAVVLLLTDRFVLRHGVNQQADVAVSEKSIAVLPFVDMSQAQDQEYFSDGIAEELLNLLAQTKLHVAARTSSFSFKGKNVEIPEIARRLHVAHVLEGSIRKAGDQVRITAQLIRAADGYNVWSETFDRRLDDIFRIQDEIAGKVVEQLKVTLLGAAPKSRTTDPEAYALFLQARQLALRTTAETLQRSDALYREVLDRDPRYAPAWDGLARNFTSEANHGIVPQKDGYRQARDAALKSLAIDPDYAPGHARLGYLATAENDLAAAAQHTSRALALDPSNPDILRAASVLLLSLGRVDEALAIDEAVLRRDPVNVTALFNLGQYQRCAGRFDAAVASLRTVLSLAPGRGNAHAQIGVALLMKGDAPGALAEIEQETSEVWKSLTLPLAYHALGREADADAAQAAVEAENERDWSYNIAAIYAYRGKPDAAFAWLDKALSYADSGLSEIARENLFDNIHSDPRWLPFLRKIGYAPEQLAKIDFKVTLPAEWQAEASADAAAATPTATR